MDESWSQLQNLEAHIKEHNVQIDKLTPMRSKHHSRQSSGVEEILKKSLGNDSQQRMIAMAKEMKEKEREILYLKSDLAGLEIYKEQCGNLKAQIKALREKNVICEREAQKKADVLSGLETNTVPRMEKLDKELKEAVYGNEKLQKGLNAAKKEAEEKGGALANLKNSYAGLDNTIKGLEEDKRSLKLKLTEIQETHLELLNAHEKNIEHLQNKEQLTLALEEDNERLRAQIEKTMESLQKCQYELGLLPKLRQEIHQREQLISAASREIEKEKNLRVFEQDEKEKLELQLGSIIESTEGENPIEYIEKLKKILSKASRDHTVINEELVNLKNKQKYNDIESTQTLQNVASCLDIIARTLPEKFLSEEIASFPDVDRTTQSILSFFCEQLQKCQSNCISKLSALQEKNHFLSECLEKLEKNGLIREKVEEMDSLMQTQKKLCEQLSKENFRIKKDLDLSGEKLMESESEKQGLIGEIDHLKIEIDRLEGFIRDSLEKMSYQVWEENWGIGDAIQFIISELKQKVESNKKLGKGLEDYKKIVDSIAEKHQIEKEGFENATAEYLARMQEMGKQIEDLTGIIDENESHLKDTLDRYNDSVGIINRKNGDFQDLEEKSIKIMEKLENYSKDRDLLSRAFVPMTKNYQSLQWQKKFLMSRVRIFEILLNEISKNIEKVAKISQVPKRNRIKTVSFMLIFVSRLKKFGKKTTKVIKIEGTTFQLCKVKVPESISNEIQFVTQLLSPLKSLKYHKFQESPRFLPEHSRLLEVFPKIFEKFSRQGDTIKETNSKLQEVISIRNENDEEMSKLLEYCKDLEKNNLELAENLENSENQMYAHSTHSAKLEQELIHHKNILKELQEAANELQEYVKVLSAQRSELQQENQLKAETISSFQQIIEKLKNAFLSISNSENSEEIQEIIELLRNYIEGYTVLQKKIEKHFIFSEEILQKLKVRSVESDFISQHKQLLKRAREESELLRSDNEMLKKKLLELSQHSLNRRESSPESSQVVQLRSTSSFIPLN